MLWIDFLLGACWGTAVSIGNYCLVQWVVKLKEGQPPQEGLGAVINIHIIGYFINILVMFLVYKNMWLLAGTGIGLTVMKNVLAIQELHKGPKVTHRGPSRKIPDDWDKW